MTYLLTQMFLYMLVTFLLGLLLGWLLWRYGQPDASALAAENKRLRSDLDTCQTKSARLEAQVDAARAAPAAAAPAEVAPPPATPASVKSTSTGPGSKPESLSAPRGGVADDLKLINGVGPKMEKLLHSLGYYHFDQIAAWKPSEVAWVDNNLEGFKGRATRDKWQAQAKVLAKG